MILAFALIAYLSALGVLFYMVLWLYPWSFMPTTVDTPSVVVHRAHPWLWDMVLMALFGLQHSLMVRPAFKKRLERWMSDASMRALYTLLSALFLGAIFFCWVPDTRMVWSFDRGIGFWVLSALYVAAWGFALVATFMIDHFSLFGLHQAWRYVRGVAEPETHFVERGFYRSMRHPIQAGTMAGLWATPQMSVGHLLFALVMSLYIMIGLYFEERDLIATFGDAYRDYRRRVPMLLPFVRGNNRT